jgi:hypothetical protein
MTSLCLASHLMVLSADKISLTLSRSFESSIMVYAETAPTTRAYAGRAADGTLQPPDSRLSFGNAAVFGA